MLTKNVYALATITILLALLSIHPIATLIKTIEYKNNYLPTIEQKLSSIQKDLPDEPVYRDVSTDCTHHAGGFGDGGYVECYSAGILVYDQTPRRDDVLRAFNNNGWYADPDEYRANGPVGAKYIIMGSETDDVKLKFDAHQIAPKDFIDALLIQNRLHDNKVKAANELIAGKTAYSFEITTHEKITDTPLILAPFYFLVLLF